ncbi:MAG: ribonuclease HII [Methanospirillum sp.]|nr:ribonuclease HII [Methanospirillum sp.]
MIAGVDEAGKGAVLGPLVVAAVASPDWEALAGLGDRDSKVLSPRRRKAICSEIVATLPFAVIEITAEAIDRARGNQTMNAIVAAAHADALCRLARAGHRPVVAYLDACDVLEGRYAADVGRRLGFTCSVVGSHHGDRLLPVVAAASILAKVSRDRVISALGTEHGPIGSGYPSDPVTRRFIVECLKTGDPLPGFVRTSWRTVSDLRRSRFQTTLL